MSPPRTERKSLPWWVHLVAAVLVIALVQGLVVKIGRVPSGSMEQTLSVGQTVFIDRLSPRWDPVTAGDVVVFKAREEWTGQPRRSITGALSLARWGLGVLGYGPGLDHFVVKRIIAEEGQSVSCCDDAGRILVDGSPIDEPYVYQDFLFESGEFDCDAGSLRCFEELVVPNGHFLMLGDHRSNSADSLSACRHGATDGCARFVAEENVIGRVLGADATND